MARLNDTKAIAKQSAGGLQEGLYGSARCYRKDRAVEAAFEEALRDGKPLPEVIRPIGRLVGDESMKGACKELDKK